MKDIIFLILDIISIIVVVLSILILIILTINGYKNMILYKKNVWHTLKKTLLLSLIYAPFMILGAMMCSISNPMKGLPVGLCTYFASLLILWPNIYVADKKEI
jgi:hypothetical protein